MNKIILSGRLTHDPIAYYGENGEISCTLASIAAANEDAQFFKIKAFSKTAEVLAKNFKKGDGITIEGKLAREVYKNVERIYISANRLEFPLTRKEQKEATGAE